MANPILELSFDESSGTVLNTGTLGSAGDITLTGNTVRTAAGSGYTFSGAAPNSKGLTQSAADTQSAFSGAMSPYNTTSRSVMFWGKAPGADPSHIMEYTNTGAGTGVFTWLMLSGTFRFRAKDSSNNVYERNLTSAPTVFHHYCATHDGTNLKVYVDGAQVGANVSMPVAVWSADVLRLFDGSGSAAIIDHVRVFDVALTSGEVTTWMNTPVGSGPTDLVIQDMTVPTQHDAVSLTQIIDLAIQKMNVATRHDAVALSQVHQIVISDMFLNTSADLVNMAGLSGGSMSVADLQAQKLPALTGKTGTVQDLLFFYYSGLSGLAPASQFSISDHQKQYWATQTGLTPSQKSMADLEKAFYDQLLVPSGTNSDREFVYWTGL